MVFPDLHNPPENDGRTSAVLSSDTAPSIIRISKLSVTALIAFFILGKLQPLGFLLPHKLIKIL